jgi:hypothetical protein
MIWLLYSAVTVYVVGFVGCAFWFAVILESDPDRKPPKSIFPAAMAIMILSSIWPLIAALMVRAFAVKMR